MATEARETKLVFTFLPGIPKRDRFAPIISAHMADFYTLTDTKLIQTFREREIEELAAQIKALPALPFSEARERELLRLTHYYEAFATLFGMDLREVARTRTQLNATVMYTSPILLQTMFDDKGKEDDRGLTFFESRIQAGGFSFNATSINIIEGYPISFSVLKRVMQDASGEYEYDYPAVSMPREVFWQLKRWHTDVHPDKPFEENPVLTYIADTFSYRIHDWVHQAVLYDTESATQIFKKWSDDSYFVEHFFHDPSMINYEFMSDKIHYLVWQQLFDEHPGTRETILNNANIFLRQLDAFDKWLTTIPNHSSPERLVNFLGYIGLRSLFNIIPLSTLKTALQSNPRFELIQRLLPEKYTGYLAKLYELVDQLYIPFRKGKNTKLSLQEILEEYVISLREEFQTQKSISVSGQLWKLGVQGGLQNLLDSIPKSIMQQMEKHLDLRLIDPRCLLMLNNLFLHLAKSYGNEVLEKSIARVEIDQSGYFYFMVDQDEIDAASNNFVTATYHKEALLIQLPWDYDEPFTTTITRSQNVIATQIGASEQVSPGGIILINIENQRLAKNLLINLEEPNSKGAFDTFWKKLSTERLRGHVALGDTYPYAWEKVKEVFSIESENITHDSDDRPILQAGYYRTKPAQRRVTRVSGPISMNSGIGDSRRRILFGCIAQNHVQTEGLDIFPITATSFDKFYQTDRLSLPRLSLMPIFAERMKIESQATAHFVVEQMLENLALINDIIIYGFRGKPQKLEMRALLSQR